MFIVRLSSGMLHVVASKAQNMQLVLYIKGVEKCLYVCASNQKGSFWVSPIRMGPPGVAFLHPVE